MNQRYNKLYFHILLKYLALNRLFDIGSIRYFFALFIHGYTIKGDMFGFTLTSTIIKVASLHGLAAQHTDSLHSRSEAVLEHSHLKALMLEAWDVTAEFPTQRPVTRSFDVFFELRLNKRWSNNREASDLRRHRVHFNVIVSAGWLVGNTYPDIYCGTHRMGLYCMVLRFVSFYRLKVSLQHNSSIYSNNKR